MPGEANDITPERQLAPELQPLVDWSQLGGVELDEALYPLRDRTILWAASGVTEQRYVGSYGKEYVSQQEVKLLFDKWPYKQWTRKPVINSDEEYSRPQSRFFQSVETALAQFPEDQRWNEVAEAGLRLVDSLETQPASAQAVREVFLQEGDTQGAVFAALFQTVSRQIDGCLQGRLPLDRLRQPLRLAHWLKEAEPDIVDRFPRLNQVFRLAEVLGNP